MADDLEDELLTIAFYTIAGLVALQLARYIGLLNPPAIGTGGNYSGSPAGAAGTSQNPVTGLIDVLVPMRVSPQGRDFIKEWEGLKLTRYGDAGGYSIGYGHHLQAGENYTTITKDKAEALFDGDIGNVESSLNSTVNVALSQDQFDALADLVYNIGAGNWQNSTLLEDLNNHDFVNAANQFSVWVHSGGQVNQNLVRRRAAEKTKFEGGAAVA